MGMLLNPKNADTISFLSDERRFIIVDPIELETSVLPLYANELGGTRTTYQQFIELLCNWGFTISNDERYQDINVYSHKEFKKGDWEKCLQIQLVGRSEAALLQRMEASRASRRMSGVGLNGDHAAMRSFLQNEMYRRLSLPAPVPQSMMMRGQMGMKEAPAAANEKDDNVAEKKEEENAEESTEPNDEQEDATNDSTMDSNKIMSEAMAALNPLPLRRPSIEQMDPSQLNAMTEQFLQRSMARRFNSRPMFGPAGMMFGGMMNNNVMKEVGAQVDAQAKMLFAQRRRSSLAMQQQQMAQAEKKEGDANKETQDNNARNEEQDSDDAKNKEREANKETRDNEVLSKEQDNDAVGKKVTAKLTAKKRTRKKSA